MAVIFKKKQVPVVVPTEADAKSEEDLTPRQQAALEAVGLGSPSKSNITIKKKVSQFSAGDRVRITNAMFFWIKAYKFGDVGTVLRSWHAPDTGFTKRPDDDVYEIELDVEREVGHKKTLVCLWELGVAGGV